MVKTVTVPRRGCYWGLEEVRLSFTSCGAGDRSRNRPGVRTHLLLLCSSGRALGGAAMRPFRGGGGSYSSTE
jgi:hypothetical protein